MEKTKTLWFRAGVEIPLTLEEYLTICRGGREDADDASNEAANQLLFSRFSEGKFRLSGETYTPMISKDAKNEWPQEDELNFEFDGKDFPTPDRIQIKLIDDNGNYTVALANTTQPIEVEVVRIDKDFEDYHQLQDYSEKLQKDPHNKKCDLTFAHFEPDEQLNSKINYVYIDAGNYKVWNYAIIKGKLTQEQISRILECADGDGWFAGNFIPSRVGLPERTMVDEGFDYDEELDTPWFEIDEDGFETTADEPTVGITPEELVAVSVTGKILSRHHLSWQQSILLPWKRVLAQRSLTPRTPAS